MKRYGNPLPALPDKDTAFRALGVCTLRISVALEESGKELGCVVSEGAKPVNANGREEQPCFVAEVGRFGHFGLFSIVNG